MNYEKLAQAEAEFLEVYPQGFASAAMQSIRKRHNVDKLVEFTHENLTQANCAKPKFICDTLLKIVSRSSMVSRFEKPSFKRFIDALTARERKALALAVEQRLFGRKQEGFEEILALLSRHKIAKWAVMSAVPFYFAPRREVFVKPTTAKGIVKLLEVEHLHYNPTPNWAFYSGYRKLLGNVKKEVDPSLSPNYAALSGFLMMSLGPRPHLR